MTEVSNVRGILMTFFVGAIVLVAFGGLTAESAEAKSKMRKHASTTPAHTTSTASTTLNTSCVGVAVEAREKSVKEAFSDYNKSIMTALDERMQDHLAAWKMSDKAKRQKVIASIWKDWKSAKSAAEKELRADRRAAWDTFRNTVTKTCREKIEDTGTGDE